jgi:hypothetical protein
MKFACKNKHKPKWSVFIDGFAHVGDGLIHIFSLGRYYGELWSIRAANRARKPNKRSASNYKR